MQYPAAPEKQNTVERRAHSRLRLKLYGRFMLEDQTEYPCAVEDISAGSLSLRADRVGQPGERIIVYVDQIGRLEGIITRTDPTGFAMTILASDRKREKLSAQLHWLASRDGGAQEDRRHERIAPRNPMSVVEMADGRKYQCRIIDLSLSGAAIEIDVKPALGTIVTLGTMQGEVVRHFEEGVAIEFANIQAADTLDAHFNRSTSASAA